MSNHRDLLIAALTYISELKPLLLNKTPTQSALLGLSLYLLAHNPLNDEKSQQIRRKNLAKFEKDCKFEETAIRMIRNYSISGYKGPDWDATMKIVDENYFYQILRLD